ncbi:NAD-dependent epimerase/dehydratase family protein [Mesorhizobium sp. BAC0120]|uniref:NAD-dependent epimerase/dehydratase family protein n=1 Tax=Mesorhizobium sp. BAC0120 TaxID=3090670 RepID=UPI00298D0CBA|nr:NAD-dependent epimerase/dehydratase family protein [Mesorhizobium sp. BAC0120]MDW6020974.1 NAD-dependent epimerase/dehydratase family protein [Mesorhizobium sp. BAC0120]
MSGDEPLARHSPYSRVHSGKARMSPKSILITGATGFVGRHLVERLLQSDAGLVLAVRDVDRCPPDWRSHKRIRFIAMKGASWRQELRPAAGQRIGTIVHLAGLAHVREGEQSVAQALEQSNVGFTHELVTAALDAGIQSFVHMSSIAAVAPNSTPLVISDGAEGLPDTFYGKTKRAAEAEVRRIAEAGGFAISLRPPLVVGADARGNWALLQKLAATGLPLPFASVHNRRSFIGIRSLAEIIASLSRATPRAGLSGAYCVAHPDRLSLREVVRLLRSGMEKPARLFPFPPVLLRLTGSAAGRGRLFAELTGDLRIDATRFFETFPRCNPGLIREEIEEAGYEFIARRGRS